MGLRCCRGSGGRAADERGNRLIYADGQGGPFPSLPAPCRLLPTLAWRTLTVSYRPFPSLPTASSRPLPITILR